ncbi:MAG: hypothetical protein ACXACA_06630 [Candidatus Ranarchaeia archaeon]|jgi:predicted transcriptional regulator
MASTQFIKKIQDFLDLQPMKPKNWKLLTSSKWDHWFHNVARFLPPIEKNIGREFAWFGVWALNETHQREIKVEWERTAKDYNIVEGGIAHRPIRDLTQWLVGTGAVNLLKKILQTLHTTYRYTKTQIEIQNALQIIDHTFFSLKQIPTEIELKIMIHLAKHPTSKIRDLASKVDMGERTIRRRLSQMRRKYFFRIAGVLNSEKMGLSRYRFYTSKFEIKLISDFLVGQSIIWSSKANRVFEVLLPNDIKTIKYIRDFLIGEAHRKKSLLDKKMKPFKWLSRKLTLSDTMFSPKKQEWKFSLPNLMKHFETSMQEENITPLEVLLKEDEQSSLPPSVQIDHLDLKVADHLLIDYKISSLKLAHELNQPIKRIQKSRNKIIRNNIVKPVPWRWNLDLPEILEIYVPTYVDNIERKIHFINKLPHTYLILMLLLPEGDKLFFITTRLPRGGGRLLRRLLEKDETNKDIVLATRLSRPYTYQPFPPFSFFNIGKQRWEYTGAPFSFKK